VCLGSPISGGAPRILRSPHGPIPDPTHLAGLLGGAFITETVFNLPGVGQYAVHAIFTNDFPSVMGVTIFGAFFIAVANLVVDIVYAYLDPRVRLTA
jgi:peptide/nickel transport system permease protein